MVVTGTHDPYLVVLSILVASFASYTALDLGGRVGAARGFARRVWLVAAATTMGSGIWSMHFVAMLALIMPIPMYYDIGLTTLSLVVAILVTSGGFYVISRPSVSRFRLVLGGTFMGLGIVTMHYTGMAAMRWHAELTHDRRFVALGPLAGIPHHRSLAKARGRGRHGPRHLRHALHRDASGHLYRSRALSRSLRTRESRSDQSGAGGRRHHVCHSGLRVDRVPVRAEAHRRGPASGAGGSRSREPGDHHGRADRLPGARSESTDCRRGRQRPCLLGLARRRHPESRRSARVRDEYRGRRNAGRGGHQPHPPALHEGFSATRTGRRERSHSGDDRPPAQRGDPIRHFGPDGAGGPASSGPGRSRAAAAGPDEPHRQRHRCDEGCGWDPRARHRVAASRARAAHGVRQRYGRGATPCAGGPDLLRILHHEAARDRHGPVHQPLHRRIAPRPPDGGRQFSAGRNISDHSTQRATPGGRGT